MLQPADLEALRGRPAAGDDRASAGDDERRVVRDLAPATGAVLHAVTQYHAATAPAARAVFGFPTAIAIEAVVADSPAAKAGLAADDGVIAIDGRR